jgi:hypothetical protein
MAISDLANLADLLGGPPYQDYIVLAGERSPGLAHVRGAGSPRNWDIRAGYGFTGAVVVFTGTGLAKFDVDIFAWENEHFGAWKKFARRCLMAPAPGLRATSMSIQHPELNDPPLTITQVVVEDVTQWEQSPSDPGLWARAIKLIQYRKPTPILVKPAEGPPGSPINVKPPDDPEVALIKTKTEQIDKLANGFTP